MTARQDDRLSMKIVTLDFLTKTKPEILAKMPLINLHINQLQNNVNTLRAFAGAQALNRTGTRKTKDKLREEITILGFEAAAQVCAYADAIGNKTLEMEVTYVYSTLQLMRDSTISSTCQAIHNTALIHINNLEPYGATVQSLLEFQDAINNYNVMLPKTRRGIITKTSYTKRIAQLFAENRILLKKIDKLVTILFRKEPEFYAQYFKSREIIQTGHRKLSLKGTITDDLGKPIEKVTITIETPDSVATQSTKLGNYQFKGIEGGVFPVTFLRDGHQPEKVFLAFTPNTRVDFNITLKPIQPQQNSA